MTSKLQIQSSAEVKNRTGEQSDTINFFSSVTESFKQIKRLRSIVGVQPVNYKMGSDRKRNLMQYYLETQFLPEFAKDISGYCLEFQADCYASRYGKDSIT